MVLASSYDQSKYFRAEDLEGRDKTLKIKGVSEEMIGQGADQSQKLVVWFENSKKGLALNRVNNRTIRGAYGDDTDDWIGKIIVIFPMQTDFRGRPVMAVRVRIPPKENAKIITGKPKLKAPKPAPAAAEAEKEPDFDDDLAFE